MSSYPKVPISYDDLKAMLRRGLDIFDSSNNNNSSSNSSSNSSINSSSSSGNYNSARNYWWPLLVTNEKGKSIDSYPDINSIAKRLIDMVETSSSSTTTLISLTSKEVCINHHHYYYYYQSNLQHHYYHQTLRSSILTQCKIKSAISGTIGSDITIKDMVTTRSAELSKLISVHKGNDTHTFNYY